MNYQGGCINYHGFRRAYMHMHMQHDMHMHMQHADMLHM